MYLSILSEPLHGNREGFISRDIQEVKTHLKEIMFTLVDEVPIEQINFIVDKRHGFIDEQHKSYLEITVKEIELGETFSLEF